MMMGNSFHLKNKIFFQIYRILRLKSGGILHLRTLHVRGAKEPIGLFPDPIELGRICSSCSVRRPSEATWSCTSQNRLAGFENLKNKPIQIKLNIKNNLQAVRYCGLPTIGRSNYRKLNEKKRGRQDVMLKHLEKIHFRSQ